MASLINAFNSLGGAVADQAGAGLAELRRLDTAQTLQQGQQGFVAGQNELNRTADVNLQELKSKAAQELARVTAGLQAGQPTEAMKNETSGVAATQAARAIAGRITELQETARLNAGQPTEAMKLLDALYPGWRATGAPGASSSSASSTSGNAVSGASSAAPTSVTGKTPLETDNPIVSHALGLPQTGSDAAIRYAIAQDVKKDPVLKDASLGQQAQEVEMRLAIAKGTMTKPEFQDALAEAIANYQKAPLDQMALMKGGGPETMAKVFKINPDYQEARYPEVVKAMAAFGSGPQGNTIRALNVGVQHLDLFDAAAQALKNNDVRLLNTLKNRFQQEFGVSAPTTFEGLKQVVGTEIMKAVAGGIGAEADRDRLMKVLDRASSPDQLQDMTNGFRGLMLGQLKGLQTQYEDATGFKSGHKYAFEKKLVPETIKALGVHSGPPSAQLPDPLGIRQ